MHRTCVRLQTRVAVPEDARNSTRFIALMRWVMGEDMRWRKMGEKCGMSNAAKELKNSLETIAGKICTGHNVVVEILILSYKIE